MANNKKQSKKKNGPGQLAGGIFNATTKKNFPVLKKAPDMNSKKGSYVSPYSIKAI